MSLEGRGLVLAVIKFFVQSGMNTGKVIALEKVIDVDLPVARNFVLAALMQVHGLDMELRRLRRHLTKRGHQVLCIWIEVHEDPKRPLSGADGTQRKVCEVEVLGAVHLWRVEE